MLTNATSVLALGTSNRFARAVDRSRSLAAQMEKEGPGNTEWHLLRLRQLGRVERRCVQLLNSLTLFYLAIGSFACASLVSLLGAVFAAAHHNLLFRAIAVIALIAGVIGVTGVVTGCTLLVSETRLAVKNLTEESALIRRDHEEYVRKIERG